MQAACMIALVDASCLHVVILCRETVFVLGAVCVYLLACDACAWTSAYLSRGQGDTVAAAHLLIKHLGSRRAASWKDESGAEITKRTKDMAQSILLKHR